MPTHSVREYLDQRPRNVRLLSESSRIIFLMDITARSDVELYLNVISMFLDKITLSIPPPKFFLLFVLVTNPK